MKNTESIQAFKNKKPKDLIVFSQSKALNKINKF